MDVLVPFAARDPKTRLAGTLDADERAAFARAMLLDVCEVLREAGAEPTVLSTGDVDVSAPVVVDDRPLTDAVNARLDPPVAVVVADVPVVSPGAIGELLSADGEVVVAPGLGGGTNGIVVRHPEFRVDYHGASVCDHRRIAEEIGATHTTVDSFRLAVDVDEPADLVEVLLHGDRRARSWLEAAGFEPRVTDGRVVAARR